MRALEPLFLATFLLHSLTILSADLLPDEPQEGGKLLLAGRLLWGLTALPSGEVLAACEDRSLSVLDSKAALVARWTASARFSAPVTVGPRSAYQLLAVPQTSGRVDVLVWDPETRVLAGAFAATHAAEAAASAWGAAGNVYLAWRDGEVQEWSPRGELLWSARAGFEVRCVLFDDSLGLYAFGQGSVVLFDQHGRQTKTWTIEGTPRGSLQSPGGDLYCWTNTGLWKKSYYASEFAVVDKSAQLLGVTLDRQDKLVLTEPNRLRRLTSEGSLLFSVPLPRQAVSGSALDDRGRILVGTSSGLEVWTYDGRLLAQLDVSGAASAPILTDKGLAAWGSTDWKVHVWTGFRFPSFGWPQDGGGPWRSFSARRPETVAVRAANWADNPEFSYLFLLAASGDQSKQSEILDRFEAQAAQGDLLSVWPYANLVLLKIARSGLTDLLMSGSRVTNSWPGLRARAYALLAKTAAPEDREELIDLLRHEYDPVAAAKGTSALAQSGWDGDGKLMRLLSELRARMSDQPLVADAVIDSARLLWQTNGRSADPVLIPLVSAVYQGPYSRTIKQKAQKFFQDLVEAP